MSAYTLNDTEFLMLCNTFYKSNKSIREFCGNVTPMSRSTFHAQIHSRLPNIDKRLYIQLCDRLSNNFKNRHNFGNAKGNRK